MKNKRAKMAIWITLILVLCFGAVSTANAATLRLIRLECWTTEDDNEFDEAELRVTIDRTLSSKYRKDMRRGDIWRINRNISFTDTVKLRLYDLDDPDGDDKLGEHIISNRPTDGVRFLIFNRDEANYRLYYRVDE